MFNFFKKKTRFEDALSVVRKELKGDLDLRRAYKDNIAMAFYDEARRNKLRVGRERLHTICNNAADCFLDLWLRDV